MRARQVVLPQVTEAELNNQPQCGTLFVDSADGQFKGKLADGSVQEFGGGAGTVISVNDQDPDDDGNVEVDASMVPYTPDDDANWDVVPDNTSQALDDLAEEVTSINDRAAIRLVLLTDEQNTADDFNITNIDDFNFAAQANSTYLCEYFCNVTSVAQAVIRTKPSYPAGVLSVYAGLGGAQSSGNAEITQPPANGTQLTNYVSTQAGDFSLMYFTMIVKTGASAGNVVFGFSGANGADATFIKADSFCRITKLM